MRYVIATCAVFWLLFGITMCSKAHAWPLREDNHATVIRHHHYNVHHNRHVHSSDVGGRAIYSPKEDVWQTGGLSRVVMPCWSGSRVIEETTMYPWTSRPFEDSVVANCNTLIVSEKGL